jgi:uroporphyrinogen-III decarboxylase
MINGVGDGFNRNLPPFVERAQDWAGDFMLFGSVPEGHEQIWRMVGPENTLLWIGLYPDEFGRFLTGPLCDFLAGCTEAQIKACDGIIDGFYIWGDIAYRNNMLFSPDYWRKYFKPVVARLCEVIHSYELPVIYHTDGNYGLVFDDLIDAGVDAFHPLEVKAGFDVVEMKENQGKRVAFVGNLDAQVLSTNDLELVRDEVLHKLHAAKNGGYMPQADHSVPAGVSGETYDYVVDLIREYGEYPLKLEI